MGNNSKKSNFSVLKWLTFREEARTEATKPLEMGRFKFFKAVLKTYTSQLFVMNLMVALCALPIFLMIGLVLYLGIENFGYAASNVSSLPYYLSNLGIGLSAGDSMAMGSVYLYQGFRILFVGGGVFLPLIGVGLSGLLHVTNKMMWMESFPVKYGKIGNPIPLIYREFFVGIKNNWWETMLSLAVAGGAFIGVSLAYLNLLERLASSTATAGSWIGVIVSTIFALVVFMTLGTLLPSIAQYHGKLNYLQKVKNSLLLSVGMFVPVAFSLGVIVAVITIFCINTFLQIIGIVLMMALGFAFIALMQTNVMHYTANNIITPACDIVTKRQNNMKGGTQPQKAKPSNVQKAKTVKAASDAKPTKEKTVTRATKPIQQTARPNYKKKKK